MSAGLVLLTTFELIIKIYPIGVFCVIRQQATQTYILALDGDVDFKPDAVRLLVDMMKKNPKVGAACGRIHPVGRGDNFIYNMFNHVNGKSLIFFVLVFK